MAARHWFATQAPPVALPAQSASTQQLPKRHALTVASLPPVFAAQQMNPAAQAGPLHVREQGVQMPAAASTLVSHCS
jgi:hypothetical protein